MPRRARTSLAIKNKNNNMLSRLKNQMQSVVILLLLLIAIPALAETIEINGYLYDINKEEKVATLMRYTGSSTSVEIPTSIKHKDVEYIVTEINYRVFRYSKMRNLIKKVTIGDSIKVIEDNTFENCLKLSSVTFGQSVTTIGYSAFCGCISLSSISIPNTVTKIGDNAFMDCHSLKSIVIGSNVTSIGYKAFSHCYKLKSVTCLANKVPATNLEAFDNTPQSDIRLTVQEAAIDVYKEDETWNKFVIN